MEDKACQKCHLHCGLHPAVLPTSHITPEQWQAYLKTAFERRKAVTPNHVVLALLISWEDNDLNDVQQETKDLAEVLRDSYGIKTSEWKIPSKKSSHLLFDKIRSFLLDNDQEGNLFIIYYGGHGAKVEEQCHWVAKESRQSASLNWASIQQYLIANTEADVLVILDCCYSGSAARNTISGRKELLTAGGKKDLATGESTDSMPTFTRALINALKDHEQKGSVVTIGELHSRLSKSDLEYSPFYCILAGWEENPILLFPRTFTASNTIQQKPKPQAVLIYVHLSGDITKEDWKTWLKTSIPGDIALLEIGEVYKSNSTILVMSVSTDLWDFIPEHSAYSYIGMVKTVDTAPTKEIDEEVVSEGDLVSKEVEDQVVSSKWERAPVALEDAWTMQRPSKISFKPTKVEELEVEREGPLRVVSQAYQLTQQWSSKGAVSERVHGDVSALHDLQGRAFEQILQPLIREIKPVDSRDQHGRSALHYAAEYRLHGIVRWLLEKGAQPSAKDCEGRTVLQWFLTHNCGELVHRISDTGFKQAGAAGQGSLASLSARQDEQITMQLVHHYSHTSRFHPKQKYTTWDRDPALLQALYLGNNAVANLLIIGRIGLEARDKTGNSPLHVAVRLGNEQMVRLLLKVQDYSMWKNHDEKTAFLTALELDNDTMLGVLLGNIGISSLGETYLQDAATQGHEDAVRLLLDRGINPNSSDGKGRTALHTAIEKGFSSVVELLLEKGAGAELADGNGSTPLLEAARHGRQSILQLLIERGVSPNIRNRQAQTALHLAAGYGSESMIQRLLIAGADVEVKDATGMTALHRAAARGHAGIVQQLLDAGADPNARDKGGITALREAVSRRDQPLVRTLLDAGANINTQTEEGLTVLHEAASSGDELLLKALLDAGAEPNKQSYRGVTALHESASRGHESLVKALLDAGADPNKRDEHGSTALHAAALKWNEVIAQQLLAAGADPNMTNYFGSTALHYAVGSESLQRLLGKKVSDPKA